MGKRLNLMDAELAVQLEEPYRAIADIRSRLRSGRRNSDVEVELRKAMEAMMEAQRSLLTVDNG